MVANAIQIVLNEDEQRAINAVKSLSTIVDALRSTQMIEGMDWGTIPGTGDKPTLLLPGMEKLMRALNAVPKYIETCIIRDYDRPLFHYEYECHLVDAGTGAIIPGGVGLGLCTSMESGFRWREQKRKCPVCGKEAIITGKKEYGGGFICWKKEGKSDGCGAKFGEDDKRITDQPIGRIENPDIFDQVNSILKRAKKRALGDAIKGAANVSQYFTVDLEDNVSYRFDADVVEGEIVETVVQPTLQQPAPEKPVSNGNGSISIDWTMIYSELKPLFGGSATEAAKAVNALKETGYIAFDASSEAIIQLVKESLQKPVETPTVNGNAPAPVDELDTHFNTPAPVEDKPIVSEGNPFKGLERDRIMVAIEDLAANDIFTFPGKPLRWLIKSIGGVETIKGKPSRIAVITNDVESKEYIFSGVGVSPNITVVDGDKFAAALKDPSVVKLNSNKQWVWVRENEKVQA